MAANDAFEGLLPQTLQLFALSYFVGIFGFPLLAGWILVDLGGGSLLLLVAMLAALEATLALRRDWGWLVGLTPTTARSQLYSLQEQLLRYLTLLLQLLKERCVIASPPPERLDPGPRSLVI